MTTGSFPRNCFIQHSIRDSRYKLIVTAQLGAQNRIANSYLDENHPHFVVPGVRRTERSGLAPKVEAAFQRWERPSRYELYDLKLDPYEWQNRATDPELSGVKARLVEALAEFQRRTRDPFIDPSNVDAFVSEQLSNRDLGYRKRKDFRWSYLDSFPEWRTTRDR